MSDKLNRLADQLEQVRVYQYEDGCNDPEDAKGRDEAVRLLRTLAPVLAKCEEAMDDLIETARFAMKQANRDGGEFTDEHLADARSALAELREVGR